MSQAVAIASGIAAAIAFGFVGVLAALGGWRRNRLLLGILTLEASLQALFGIGELLGNDPAGTRLFYPTIVLLAVFAWSYFVFLGRIESPLVRWTRSRVTRAIVGFVVIGASLALDARVLIAESMGPYEGDSDPFASVMVLIVFAGVALVALLSLAGSVHAWHRAPRGTTARARAGAFALAFGTRDAILAGGLLLSELTPATSPLRPVAGPIGDYAFAVATIVYVPLLAYGILKTQLFDLDLRVKIGIEKSTLLTIVAIAVLVTQRIVERYATAAYGWAAAVVAAVLMLLLKSKLDKVAAKVANTAMPQVQPTPAYVQFKKLEVYKAAVESANEVGMDDKQRRMLDKLASKLGLGVEDRAAIEAEVVAA